MSKEIDDEIHEIVDAIINEVNVSKLYLLGSFAYGNPTEDSDFDIYAVLPNDSDRPIIAIQKIRKSIYNIKKRPVDILALDESTFYKRVNGKTLENQVLTKGIKLYGNDRQLYEAIA